MLGTSKVMLGPGLHFLFLQGSGSGAVAGHLLSLTTPPSPCVAVPSQGFSIELAGETGKADHVLCLAQHLNRGGCSLNVSLLSLPAAPSEP